MAVSSTSAEYRKNEPMGETTVFRSLEADEQAAIMTVSASIKLITDSESVST